MKQAEIETFFSALRGGLPPKLAATRAGVSWKSVNNLLRKGREVEESGNFLTDDDTLAYDFLLRFRREGSERPAKLIDVLNEAAEAGDTKAAQWLLTNVWGHASGAVLPPEETRENLSVVTKVVIMPPTIPADLRQEEIVEANIRLIEEQDFDD